MKLHGYCTVCRKFKRVNVWVPSLGRGTPMGVCDACQDKQDKR